MAENRTNRVGPSETAPGTFHLNIVTTIVVYALSRGITAEEIAQATGFNISALGDPDARISDDVVPKLWQMLLKALPNVPVTLEAACAAPFTTIGGLAHGMQFAATLREAFDFHKRNREVLADRLEIRIEERPDEVRIIGRHPIDDQDSGCMAEMGACLMVRFVREVLGIRKGLIRVDLLNAPRGPHYDYETHFQCPVRFSADTNALVFLPEMLEAKVRMAEPTLFSFVEQHFELQREQIESGRIGGDMRILRRAISDSAAAGSYSIGAVLQRAGFRRRSAQRIAETHDTTLSALIEEARRKNAEAFLSDSAISVEMAASLLGYSDDRAFRRAFKRWTGQSPTEFRKSRGLNPGKAL
ncbi:MAG: AraC family transcriptional regulator ligand-binding domain-containing protein [Pseudomonadota bacterium]